MGGRLDVELFVDPLAREAFAALTELAVARVPRTPTPEVATLLRTARGRGSRRRGAPPKSWRPRVVVNSVEASSQRLLASMLRT